MAYLRDQSHCSSLTNTCTHWERIRGDVFILSERVMHSSGMGHCVGWADSAKRRIIIIKGFFFFLWVVVEERELCC